MNIAQIEVNLQNLLDNFSKDEFIYELMLAYGISKSTITLIKKGNRNLSKKENQIILKKKLFFQNTPLGDLHGTIDALRKNTETLRHDPRFIIVTDYITLLAVDTKTSDTLDIKIGELAKHFDFFLPWAGLEKAQLKMENPADVKAAERMAKLYDEILRENPIQSESDLHALNVFLSRLLFCYFAEDTGIFEKKSFTTSIASHTQPDGEDLDNYLNRLFEILNTRNRTTEPVYLKSFPYVNGGLFGHNYKAPKFTRRSHKMVIDCGLDLNWSAINPDIFGSMIQAVVHPDQREGMGMHYTSVPNIMKVIEPLFLNDLKADFENSKNHPQKLDVLLKRLGNLRIFDPACGSGNFLIIAYKEIRKLEIEVLKRLAELQRIALSPTNPQFDIIPKSQLDFAATYQPTFFSRIEVSQFYGIELDDFAHEVAILSLWLAEHQMNMKFKEIFGTSNPSLPLRQGGNIVHGNATETDWIKVCPISANNETYILGNPPYRGSKVQSKENKEDMKRVFSGIKNYKDLDYIACWFYLAAKYIQQTSYSFAFVTTNSICQGNQIALLWPLITNARSQIFFATPSFKWANNAKHNAGVTCSIIGICGTHIKKSKFLYYGGVSKEVENINYYLTSGKNIIVSRRSKPVSELPKMDLGNMPIDDGNLIFSESEKNTIIQHYPESKKLFKKLYGTNEFIKGNPRWCLWIDDQDLRLAQSIPDIMRRIEAVRTFRLKSKDEGTNKLAERPHQFREMKHAKNNLLIVARVSSERREYIPMEILSNDSVISDAQVVYDPPTYLFGVLSSKLHVTWVKATSGSLESRIRYSSALSYNNFPLPKLSLRQKESISQYVFNILEAREAYSEKTIEQLYDPDKMPANLREAHQNLDQAIERCYRSRPFTNDEERLEYLFKYFEEMMAEQQGDLSCLT